MIVRAEWSPRAIRDLERLSPVDVERIAKAGRGFVDSGLGDVETPKGRPFEYRLRVGEFRLLFALDHARQTMVVQGVAPAPVFLPIPASGMALVAEELDPVTLSLINAPEDDEEETEEERLAVAAAMEDVRQGRTLSAENLAKELGIEL